MFEPTEQEKRQFLLLILFSLVLTGWFYATEEKSHTLEAFVPAGRAFFRAHEAGDDPWGETVEEYGKADVNKVFLNTSPRDYLLECPGIGPSFADRIIEERRKGGPFTTWENLRTRISGMGPVKIEILQQAGVKLGP